MQRVTQHEVAKHLLRCICHSKKAVVLTCMASKGHRIQSCWGHCSLVQSALYKAGQHHQAAIPMQANHRVPFAEQQPHPHLIYTLSFWHGCEDNSHPLCMSTHASVSSFSRSCRLHRPQKTNPGFSLCKAPLCIAPSVPMEVFWQIGCL